MWDVLDDKVAVRVLPPSPSLAYTTHLSVDIAKAASSPVIAARWIRNHAYSLESGDNISVFVMKTT